MGMENEKQKADIRQVQDMISGVTAQDLAALEGAEAQPMARKVQDPRLDDDEGEPSEFMMRGPGAPPKGTPSAGAQGLPDWVSLPPGYKVPGGRGAVAIRVLAKVSGSKHGDRQCLIWGLSVNDERLALQRTGGDPMKTLAEFSKQMLRVIDGELADWANVNPSSSVTAFWEDIGPKYRQMIQSHYAKSHSMTQAERLDFFANCIVELP